MKMVSIIIPVYNSEHYVEKCIRSVLDQSYSELDIIVINDGSQDQSGEILENLAMEDQRIRLVTQENQGVSFSRNLGVKMAKGQYLTFVDGDDYLGKEYIRELVECAEKNDADMVISGMTLVEETGSVLQTIVPGEYIPYEKEEWTFRISAAAAHLYRKELWDKYQILFAGGVRGEDMPISLFFSAICGKIATVCQSEYYYVQHPASAMHNFKGLRNYRLPYHAIEETIQKVNAIGIQNSEEYFELFVMRILATCIQLARGAKKKDILELSRYIEHILHTYFPEYYRNSKAKLIGGADVPFKQRIAVWVMVKAVRWKVTYPFLKVVCK